MWSAFKKIPLSILVLSLLNLGLDLNTTHAAPKKKTKKTSEKKTSKKKHTRKSRGKQPPVYSSADESLGYLSRKIQNLGQDVIMSVDRLVKKKSFTFLNDPWTVQGIPIIFPGQDTGFHLGVHIQMNDIRRQDPHTAQLTGQVLASDKGKYKHSLTLDLPRAFKSQWRITARMALDRDITQRYFGISNDTTVNRDLIDQNSVLFQNTRHQPNFFFQVLKRFGRSLFVGPVLGLKWSTISFPAGSLLAQESPTGIHGGRTHYLGLAIILDTTDFEPYPSRGYVHELFLTVYDNFIGSDYRFFRGTYVYKKFWPLHRRLTLAHRTFFESINGDAPFYELGVTGGRNPSIGFGGNRYLRGYPENQYIGNIKTALGLELRWDPLHFKINRQTITLGFAPFFDVGRVWNTNRPLKFGPWHASTGWGVRAIWNYRLILRGDFALTGDGAEFLVELGNAF